MEKNYIAVVCYNAIEYWESRKKAKAFYKDCMRACEGSEGERYTNIYFDLEDGLTIAQDGCSAPYEVLLKEKRIKTFDNPNNTRDYGGKIYYPKN